MAAGEQRMWLYGIAMFATGVLFVSSFWRVEAAYFSEQALPLPRAQSAYYVQRGLEWFKAGTAVTIIACTLLIFDSYTHFLVGTELNTAQVLGLIFLAGIVCCLFCFWLASGRREISVAALVLYIIVCAAYFLLKVPSLMPFSMQTFSATLLLVVLLIDHRSS